MADGIYQKHGFDLLAKRMVRRDGYTLEHVGGAIAQGSALLSTPTACVIKRLGRCDVRVVLRDSAVSKEDVAGFEREVALSGGHGIMCTREGKVPGRCAVDFRRVSTGRFVWYLSEIGDNADAVVVFTRALYGMDERSGEQAVGGASGASGEQVGSATSASAERLMRDSLAAEVAWAKKVMKAEAEEIEEARARAVKRMLILADVYRPPSAERGAEGCAEGCDRGSTSKITWLARAPGTADGDTGAAIRRAMRAAAAKRAAAAGGKSSTGPPAVRPVVVVVSNAKSCARGYELIKVDGERRYKCVGCNAVRASGEDMKKHLRTCVGGRKKAADDAEGSAQGSSLLSTVRWHRGRGG